MYEIIFIVLLFLYFIVSVKVDYWMTIYALGFKSETPLLFLRNPGVYNLIRTLLFVGTAASTFFFNSIPWFLGLMVLVVLWGIAGSSGRNRAYKAYREIMKSLIDPEESHEDNEYYKNKSVKTDEELSNMVQISMKSEI